MDIGYRFSTVVVVLFIDYNISIATANVAEDRRKTLQFILTLS